MNLTIDIGNTTTKVALFDDRGRMTDFKRYEGRNLSDLASFAKKGNATKCIVCSTITVTSTIKSYIEATGITDIVFLTWRTPVPITNLYRTPKTLGMDRLAAAVGGYFEAEERDVLIIDMGTAITYYLVTSEGNYLGGNISPGIEMRFRALNAFTDKLPLITSEGNHPELGYDTETAMRCGVLDGIKHEIEGIISQLIIKYPNLLVFLTGGENLDFAELVKKRIFADKYLVLKGLNKILTEYYNKNE